MKKILIACLSLAAIFTISCSKSNDTATQNPINTTTVTNTASSGTWRITYFWDTDNEETTNYAGYSFTFGANNTVAASKSGASSVAGTWATGTDNSTPKFILTFTSPALFSKLSSDWHIIELTTTKIALKDVSGGNGGTDYLTFEKN